MPHAKHPFHVLSVDIDCLPAHHRPVRPALRAGGQRSGNSRQTPPWQTDQAESGPSQSLYGRITQGESSHWENDSLIIKCRIEDEKPVDVSAAGVEGAGPDLPDGTFNKEYFTGLANRGREPNAQGAGEPMNSKTKFFKMKGERTC